MRSYFAGGIALGFTVGLLYLNLVMPFEPASSGWLLAYDSARLWITMILLQVLWVCGVIVLRRLLGSYGRSPTPPWTPPGSATGVFAVPSPPLPVGSAPAALPMPNSLE